MKKSYWTNSRNPGVSLTIAKNEVKPARDGMFYLKDGQDFELKLENKGSYPILAKISWNGADEPNGLILTPGQKIFLERFLNENKRLTYKVAEISEELKDFVDAKLGEVKVSFYKEIITLPDLPGPTSPYPPSWPIDQGPGSPYLPNHPYNPYYYSDNTSGGPIFRSNDLTLNASNMSLNSKSIKVGKISQGEKTSQEFIKSNREFEDKPFYEKTLNIIPIENKPADLLIRKYCSECGSKKKDKWKYCPYCGEKN